MTGSLAVLLLSGSPLAVFYFFGYLLLYLVIDILLVVAVIKLYKGSGGLGSMKAVSILALLSAAFGLYALLSFDDGDQWLSILIAVALPLAMTLLAAAKSTSSPRTNT